MKVAAIVLASFAFASGHTAVASAARRVGPGGGRRLQNEAEDDPCAVPFEDATRAFTDGPAYLRSEYFERCYESLAIDRDNMVEHIYALNAYFEEYYCFYNIARDPSASSPQEHQPELGYEIWQEGTVDIHARLDELASDVKSNGASMATFWDIQEIFNQLRDAHVRLPDTPPLFDGFDGGTTYLIPESVLNDGFSIMPLISYMESDQGSAPELELKVSFAHDSGAKEEKTVQTMNGESVLSFFLRIANKGAGYFPPALQSEGARFNNILALFGDGYDRYFMSFARLKDMRPSSLLPDSFEVTYTDGSSETYYSLINITAADAESVYEYFTFNKTQVEEKINQPGDAYSSFQRMAGEIEAVKNASAEPIRRLEQTIGSRQLQTNESSQRYNWDFEDLVNSAAYKITDDYAVLKIQSFGVSPDYVIGLWANFTKAAKSKGVTKAMIDISKNPGGQIRSGDVLTISLFPMVSYDWFFEQLDQTYNNGMVAWNEYVVPLEGGLESFLNKVTDQELQTILESFTPNQQQIFLTSAKSLFNFCHDSGLNEQELCQPFITLMNTLQTLLDFPSGPQLRTLLQNLDAFLHIYNPFQTGSERNVPGYDWSIIHSVNRGGVYQNLTSRYTMTTKEVYNAAVASALQVGHSFEEYILVSDGVAGSTADIFATSVLQMWANRDKSGVTTSVKGITYGGSPDPKATTLASAPANVLDDIAIESNIVAYTCLFLVSNLLPKNSTDRETWTYAKESFGDATPIPPYFANTFPDMPIRNYYSKFMGPGALPLQYVTLPATDHIPQIYRFNKIDQSRDLHALYTAASKFFAQDHLNTTEDNAGDGSGTADNAGNGEVSGAADACLCFVALGVATFVSVALVV